MNDGVSGDDGGNGGGNGDGGGWWWCKWWCTFCAQAEAILMSLGRRRWDVDVTCLFIV